MSEGPNGVAILLAGGAGTRLWPLSTEACPKQFLRLFEGRSLLQLSWDRISRSFPPDRIFVSTQPRYRHLVLEQLDQIGEDQLLLEPVRRNTGPAIAACCFEISRRFGDCVIGIFPSDHFIADQMAFGQTIATALGLAAEEDLLVTVGIAPTEPATGFGYLELGESIEGRAHRVVRFVEKPERARASQFLAAGHFRWNGGMFVWRGSVFERELRIASPEIADLAVRFAESRSEERARAYEMMPDISIDYALMEKTSQTVAVDGAFDWSDVGSWRAVASLTKGELSDSAVIEDGRDVYVRSDGHRPLVVAGVNRIVVIDSPNGLLVLDLDRPELLREAVRRLGSKE